MVHLRQIPPTGLADGVLVIAALPVKAEVELSFLGPMLPDDVARSIAEGTLSPTVSKYMDATYVQEKCSTPCTPRHPHHCSCIPKVLYAVHHWGADEPLGVCLKNLRK